MTVPAIRPSGLQVRKSMGTKLAELSPFHFFLRGYFSMTFSVSAMIPITAELIFLILYIFLERSVSNPVVGAFGALVLAEICVLVLCITVKKLLVGNKWGANHSTPFWSWRHFAYFLHRIVFSSGAASRCGFWQGRPLQIPYCDGWAAGSENGHRHGTDAMFRLERREFWQ